MAQYKCEEMMCGHCVSRIARALDEAKIGHQIDLESKTVIIDDGERCGAIAEEILSDLGFSPEKIS